jgi:hypothetical protein
MTLRADRYSTGAGLPSTMQTVEISELTKRRAVDLCRTAGCLCRP